MRVFVSFENITIQCRNRITMISYSQYYRKLSLVAMEFVILNFLTRLSEVSGPRYRTTIIDLMPPSRVGVGNRTEIDLIFKMYKLIKELKMYTYMNKIKEQNVTFKIDLYIKET